MEIADYDSIWPQTYAREAAGLMADLAPVLILIEHIGSTAVPGLPSKPVIDMMTAVAALPEPAPFARRLAGRGYVLTETGMRDRLLFQRSGRPAFNLHVVTLDSWPDRHERRMRDALRDDPAKALEYGALKRRLAKVHGDDIASYTIAKTGFIQDLMNEVHDRLGIPHRNVWED